MRRARNALLVLILATSCGARAEVSKASPLLATPVATSIRTEFPKRTITPLCVGAPNLFARRSPDDQGGLGPLGALMANVDFIGVGAIGTMYAPTAFSLVIPGQTTWVEIVEDTVFTGGITRVDDLHLASGTKVRVTICRKLWDASRKIGDWQGFYRLAAIGPA